MPPPRLRGCDEPGCAGEGQFRAPRSRDCLDRYYWFCIDHIRAYNAAWNYYAGMNDGQIEAEIRRDTVWQRPSWPLGWNVTRLRYRDPLDLFGAGSGPGRQGRTAAPPSQEERARTIFELAPLYTLEELRTRYKVLVKRHHPDANGGDKAAEEKLKTINEAYALLKARIAA